MLLMYLLAFYNNDGIAPAAFDTYLGNPDFPQKEQSITFWTPYLFIHINSPRQRIVTMFAN